MIYLQRLCVQRRKSPLLKVEVLVVDISKQVQYWRAGASEDLDTSRLLIHSDKLLPGLFFLHLATEKMIKGLYCRGTGELAPRTHDLPRLIELAGIEVSNDQRDLLAILTRYNLEGRYPMEHPSCPPKHIILSYWHDIAEMLRWFETKL